MQRFFNRDFAERAAAELLSSARTRYYLMIAAAVCIALAASAAIGAVWLGVALLVEETRRTLMARLNAAPAAATALDFVSAASFAAAPALIWFGSGSEGGVAAIALLGLLMVQSIISTTKRRRIALLTHAPYILAALTMSAHAAMSGATGAGLAALFALGSAFCAALHYAHRARAARAQDAEWLRQLNMTFGETRAAAWEIDFAEKRLIGAERLAALIGRPVAFADIAESAAIATPEDRALVRAAFAPGRAPPRRIALEHDVLAADGMRVRVRHQGFVRTAPDGAPVRITCVSRLSEAAAQTDRGALERAFAAQQQTLKALHNELSLDFSPARAACGLDAALAQIAEQAEQAEEAVCTLAHARHAADSANLAKSQFLANMSHELRTPLNAIIGYAEMLQEDAEDSGDAAAVQDLNRILAAAKHLLSLLNEILDLSKIEAGRMDVSAAPFEPADMLRELIETIRPLADQNRNEVRFACSDEGAATTDSLKLRQCALNLLSNACKFTKDGVIEVSLERRAHNGAPHLFVSVRDTGIGMSSEHLARLFQPFVQADPNITQKYGGTGLGLTITRRLAQLLGGDVSVTSALGQGSTFTLAVPADFADAPAALGAAAEIDALQGAQNAPLVLVIEDEADARELAARALTRAGFAVQGVGGGEAGLALARSKNPALVLLDIFLPDRSGWRVLQSLKHDPKTQDIPVVVLSVNEDRAHALALGAAEHMIKPADRDKLAATVMRFARLPARPSQPADVEPVQAQNSAG